MRFIKKNLLRNADQYFSEIEAKTRRWICYKDAPAAPAPPDYTAAAYAQGAANVDTARAQGRMNNPNIYTPYGSQTVTWGNNQSSAQQSAPSGHWSEPTWSPDTGFGEPTWIPDSSAASSSAGNAYGGDQPTITQTLAPAQQALLDAQNRISGNLAGIAESGLNRVGTGLGTPFDASGINPVQTNAGVNPNYTTGVTYNPLAMGYNSGGNVQGNINTAGVQAIPTVDAAARQHAEDLAYRAATSRLDPQWAQRQAQQDTQLRNQGLVAGGEAYDAAKRDLGYQQNDAYLQAQANAVAQGLANQQAQFGMGLAANQAGFGQAQAQGQFANAAQAQANAQNAAQAQFANQAAQNQFQMGLANANLANQVGQQQFQQGLANANLGNQAAQQQIQQQAYLRSLPLNELNALRTGSQVQNPAFQPYAGVNIGQTPIFNAATAQGVANQQQYANQVGQANAFNQGLFGLGAAALGAPMGTFGFLR